MSAALPLRDVHLPASAPWWPPAPGWWLLAGLVLLLLVIAAVRYRRRRRRRAHWQREFRDALVQAGAGPARLAAMLDLLRRAAREHQPGSERLQGEAWVQMIDPGKQLDAAQQELLLHGAWRPELDETVLAQLEQWAARRFVQLLLGARR